MSRVEAEQTRTDDIQQEEQRLRADQQATRSRGNPPIEKAAVQPIEPTVIHRHVTEKYQTPPHFNEGASRAPGER